MGRDALIIEAELALANWSKYSTPPSNEIVYQAEKMANVLRKFIYRDKQNNC